MSAPAQGSAVSTERANRSMRIAAIGGVVQIVAILFVPYLLNPMDDAHYASITLLLFCFGGLVCNSAFWLLHAAAVTSPINNAQPVTSRMTHIPLATAALRVLYALLISVVCWVFCLLLLGAYGRWISPFSQFASDWVLSLAPDQAVAKLVAGLMGVVLLFIWLSLLWFIVMMQWAFIIDRWQIPKTAATPAAGVVPRARQLPVVASATQRAQVTNSFNTVAFAVYLVPIIAGGAFFLFCLSYVGMATAPAVSKLLLMGDISDAFSSAYNRLVDDLVSADISSISVLLATWFGVILGGMVVVANVGNIFDGGLQWKKPLIAAIWLVVALAIPYREYVIADESKKATLAAFDAARKPMIDGSLGEQEARRVINTHFSNYRTAVDQFAERVSADAPSDATEREAWIAKEFAATFFTEADLKSVAEQATAAFQAGTSEELNRLGVVLLREFGDDKDIALHLRSAIVDKMLVNQQQQAVAYAQELAALDFRNWIARNIASTGAGMATGGLVKWLGGKGWQAVFLGFAVDVISGWWMEDQAKGAMREELTKMLAEVEASMVEGVIRPLLAQRGQLDAPLEALKHELVEMRIERRAEELIVLPAVMRSQIYKFGEVM